MAEAETLARVPLFAALNEADLGRLAQDVRSRRYRKDETIFVTGDPGTTLCVIDSGRVKLCLSSTEGREMIIDLLGQGDHFGELALLDGEPRSADAIAVEPTQLMLLPRDAFLRFLRERPDAAIALLGVLSRRLRRDAQLLQDTVFLDVPARLARTILRLAEPNADGQMRTPRLNQTNLAAVAGTTRETVNKWLGYYCDEGLIRLEHGRITVLEPERLRKRIN